MRKRQKRGAALFLGTIMAGLACLPCAAGENLIENPGFEMQKPGEDLPFWKPVFWCEKKEKARLG